jgi:hypothetical protein
METTFMIVCEGKAEGIEADYFEGSYSDEVWAKAGEIAEANPGKAVGIYRICYWVEQTLPIGE